jgi:hypothetical protein
VGAKIGELMQSREERQKLIEEVKSHPGMLYQWKKKVDSVTDITSLSHIGVTGIM